MERRKMKDRLNKLIFSHAWVPGRVRQYESISARTPLPLLVTVVLVAWLFTPALAHSQDEVPDGGPESTPPKTNAVHKDCSKPSKEKTTELVIVVEESEKGAPVSGADIIIKVEGCPAIETTANEKGQAKIQVPHGTANIQAYGGGWNVSGMDLDLKNEKKEILIQLKPRH
jgi:hypothetical protein